MKIAVLIASALLAAAGGPVQPAFGYRVDFRGRSVAFSGDTMPSDNLVTFASGVDLRSTMPLVRQNYAGPVEFGEDSMSIVIGNEVTVQRQGAVR